MFASPVHGSPSRPQPIGVLADLAAWGIEVGGTATASPAAPPADPAGTLTAVVAHVERVLGGFRGETCTGAQALAVVEATARLVRVLEAAQLRGLDRVEETGAWRDDRSRSCAAWAMRALDCSYGQARARVACAVQLRGQPHLARLAATGEVPLDKLLLGASTVAERPDAGVEVSTAARAQDRSAFRASCRRIRQAGETDEERLARQRRARRAATATDEDGMFELRALGPADEGAELWSLFQPWVDDALREAWALGARVTGEQARWDGLLNMARAAAEPPAESTGTATGAPAPSRAGRRRRPRGLARGRGSRVKVIIRVDLAALLRGWVRPDELCDLSGVGEIDVASVGRLIADGAFVTTVLTGPPGTDDRGGASISHIAHLGRAGPDGALVPPTPAASGQLPIDADDGRRFVGHLLDTMAPRLQPVDELVHHRRPPNATQRSALEFLHPTCSVPGCTMAAGLEIDHVAPWIETGTTALVDLDRKCHLHHGEKSRREAADRAEKRRSESADRAGRRRTAGIP